MKAYIIFLFQKIFLFLNILKYCKLYCDNKTLPFLSGGVCISACRLEDLRNETCILDNEIIKTQWINNIIYISENGFNYINMATTQNNDLIILISSFPNSNTRILYGITKEGLGYFDGIKKYPIEINDYNVKGRYESEIFMVKLSQISSDKEYIMSFGKILQNIEIYDLDSKNIYFHEIDTMFYRLYQVDQLVGAYLKLTSNDYNYYLIGLLSIHYDYGVGKSILTLIKFKIDSLGTNIGKTFSYREIDTYQSRIVSCFEISITKHIICFYKNKYNKYTIAAFTQDLIPKTTDPFASADENTDKFFKCVNFFDEIGAFIYYSNDRTPYATLIFKKYCQNSDTITEVFSSIQFNNYLFSYNGTLNDFIKVDDKKIYFAAVSLDRIKLYIISIYNYDQDKFMQRIYEINSFVYNEYYFYNTIRINIFNNYLAFCLNGFVPGSISASSLIVFSYPNSTDIDNELSQYLFNNNEIKINNITLEPKKLCKIENNIFGLILTGIKIIEINKTSNEYLSLLNGTELTQNKFLSINDNLKLIISKNENIYNIFNYKIKYSCQATEPEYEEYNKYPIDFEDTGTSNKENSFFEKKTYLGRYSYYYFKLNNKLTDEGCNKECNLCYFQNKESCITCRLGFEIIEGNKICDEEIVTTIVETTIPERIETTIPERIETTIPERIETTTIPERIETTIPERIETTIPERIETTIPERIETTIPERIETTIPERIETTIPERIETTVPKFIETSIFIQNDNETTIITQKNIETNIILETIFPSVIETISENKICNAKFIIKGICHDKLTDEMGEEIYLYMKYELINSNFTEENILIKTPSIAFQLTDNEYQKNNDLNISIIDLGECEKKLKEKYEIPEEYDLIIFKIDIQDYDKALIYVQYEIYHPVTFKQLNLDVCKNIPINITIPAYLDSETILVYESLNSSGYNLFNSNDKFYNDICTTYTTINNTDILLIDRKTDIYNKYANISICQENCDLVSYNDNSKRVSCFCYIQSNVTNIDLNIQPKFILKGVQDIFFNYLNNSNFRVLKCYRVAIDLSTIFENIGRIIMSVIVLIFVILFIIFLIKGNKHISLYLNNIKIYNSSYRQGKNDIKNKVKENVKNTTKNLKLENFFVSRPKINIKNKKIKKLSCPVKIKKNKFSKYKKNKKELKIKNSNTKVYNTSSSSTNKIFNNINLPKKKLLISQNYKFKNNKNNNIFKSSKNNNIFFCNIINNFDNKKLTKNHKIKKNLIPFNLNDYELNSLDYNKALTLDKRTYFQYYFSLLKKKHLILFTFLPMNDYNLQYIKIMLFLLSFSLYFNINGFFFGDETMHDIYISYGFVNYVKQIASIIYSSVIPSIIYIILKLLSLSERDVLALKHQKEEERIFLKRAKKIRDCMKIKFTIFFIISFLFLFFFWYFISCFCGVYKNNQKILIIDTLISFGLSMVYPFGLNLLPGMLRIPALRAKKKDKRCLYQISTLVALI